MINKKRAKRSVQHWKHESKETRDRLMNGERMSFEDFIMPRIRQNQATDRLRKAK